jgi:hypothetical protein
LSQVQESKDGSSLPSKSHLKEQTSSALSDFPGYIGTIDMFEAVPDRNESPQGVQKSLQFKETDKLLMLDSISNLQDRFARYDASIQKHVSSHLSSQIQFDQGYQGLDPDLVIRLRGGLVDPKSKR